MQEVRSYATMEKEIKIGYALQNGKESAMAAVIYASHLNKSYFLKEKSSKFCSAFIGAEKSRRKEAIKDVSFSIAAGEAVGIIGRNGAGKSTLLKLICGVTAPEAGEITVKGSLTALLELGAGFHPEYTGMENIYLNGTLNGRSREEIRTKLPEILDFADIGEYIFQPVKTYSDGMFLRLAFASAALWEPEILVVDEALAVGDFLFQTKCFQKIRELKKKGVTVLYVTHDIDTVRRLCSRALWLEDGRLRMDGTVEAVTSAYMAAAVGQSPAKALDKGVNRFGSHVGSVLSVTAPHIWQYQEKIMVKITVEPPKDADSSDLSVSLAVKNREGLDLLVLRTVEMGHVLKPGRLQTVQFSFFCPFTSGRYTLAVGLEQASRLPITYYDYWEGMLEVKATAKNPSFGIFHIPAEVDVHEENQT